MMDPVSSPAPDPLNLAALPATMAGRPFGADETGRPVGRTKGPVIRATIGCMLACVEQRVAAIDPASVDQARTSALAELVARLNSAILDPRYHVTADYLMDEGHSYSVEFDTFLGHICRELSGDPAFHFNRGARGIPGLVVLLARPFSLSQVYHRLPGFAAKLADVDLRVVTVTPTSAVIRWHGDRDIARLPQGLHQLFIEMDCQYMQGALAAIPRLHSGQPMATVRELQCQLRGDPCCEWEISWSNPPGAHHVPTLEGVAVTRSLKAHPAGSHKAGRVIGLAAGSQPDEQFYPVPVVLPDSALPPLPPFIEGLPYGADQDGRPIRQITGTGLIGAIREMQDQIGQQVGRELPAAMDPEERLAQINQAQLAALDRLVERLNVVIPDPRYHVTPDYLLNESNYYSHEFNLYLNEFAREITGDPRFHFHRGRRSIPPTILTLARPLSIRQIYALLPRFTARVTEAEFHVISTTSASAVIQWRPARQLAHLPPTLHRRYCHMACQAYQGVFAAIPWEHSRLPLARIQERRCLMQGDDCCEWEFSWELARPNMGLAVWGGLLLSTLLLVYILAQLPGWEWVAAATALLPAATGWLLWRYRQLAGSKQQAERLLWATRDDAERQFGDFQQTNADLQLSNITLNQKLAELTALHEIGLALSATLDVSELLDKSLQAVTAHLSFDRALILLVEERKGRSYLTFGRMSGGTQEMDALLAELRISLEASGVFLAEVIRSGQPALVRDTTALMDDGVTRTYLEALHTSAFLAVPLITQGRAVGLLAVDNALTGRPIPETIQDLLFTVGAQIAAAVDSARLYRTLEQRVAERTAELAHQNEYLAALHDTTVGLISRLDVNELLETLVTRAGQLLHAPHGFIYLLEPGEAEMVCKVGVGALIQSVGARRKLGDGLGGRVWQTGQPLIVDDYDHWPGRLSKFQPGLLGAIMGVPLKSDGQVVGAIGLAQDAGTQRTFGADEVALLSRFAHLASVALDNARLYSAAQETRRRLTDIIEFLPDATLVIDGEGRVIAWNRAIEEMTGIAAEEMLGKGDYEYAIPFYGERRPILIDLVHRSQEELEQKYAQIQRLGATLIGETFVPRLQGDGRYLFAAASVLRDARGNTVGAIETLRDITERRRIQEELQEAKEVAEAATQAKSTFLAMMSHEIRTPMNAIIGMSGLLLDTPLTMEQRDYADTIRTSGDALLTIINDILDFSKIEAGKMTLEEQPFDLRDCVESALDLVRIWAVEKGLELAQLVDPAAPVAIIGDSTRLRQILINLLSNAIKFTEEGEVVVTAALADDKVTRWQGDKVTAPFSQPVNLPVPDGSQFPGHPVTLSPCHPVTLLFSIRDTGIGIPAGQMDQLFQPFTQADVSTSRRYGGTGLGLAVSKRLAEMMGGAMWAESAGVGQGATFHFTIPTKPALGFRPGPHLAGPQPQLAGHRVLIVDDNDTNRRILAAQTRLWGMEPCATGSPSEVLAWLRRGDVFDVAILDMHMPEMTGIELARQIRASVAPGLPQPALPLILASVPGGRETVADTTAFFACLAKPIRPSALFETLMSALAAHPAPDVRLTAPKPVLDPEMATRHPLRILLAEDNAVNQKLALHLLAQMGYRADVAANGIEAIQAVERQCYDVVLMDVQMPEMDGLETTRYICARWSMERRPRIIAMTANAMQGDRELCLEAGMDDYLAKPISVKDLVTALSQCRALARGATPAGDTVISGDGVIDRSVLVQTLESVGGDREFLDQVLATYRQDAPDLIAALEAAQASVDADALRRAAHSLKSTSASVGAMRLAAACKELETLAKDGDLTQTAARITRIEAEYAAVEAVLQVSLASA